MSSTSSDSEKFDPSRRRLCPDGACIGLIGEDGRCRECGRSASGKPEAVTAPASSHDGWPDQEEAAAEPGVEAEGDGGGGFDPRRKLCQDGACVGVIGEDGRCKVCGQAG